MKYTSTQNTNSIIGMTFNTPIYDQARVDLRLNMGMKNINHWQIAHPIWKSYSWNSKFVRKSENEVQLSLLVIWHHIEHTTSLFTGITHLRARLIKTSQLFIHNASFQTWWNCNNNQGCIGIWMVSCWSSTYMTYNISTITWSMK